MLDQQYEVKSSVPSSPSSDWRSESMDSRDSKVSDQLSKQVKPKLRVQGFNFFYGLVQALCSRSTWRFRNIK